LLLLHKLQSGNFGYRRLKIINYLIKLTLIEVVLCLLLSPPSSGTIGAKNMIEVCCLSLRLSNGFPCCVEVR